MTSLFDIPLTSRLSREEAYQLVDLNETDELLRAAARRRDAAHGDAITYSPKVFIPLTQLCRDVCHYCTFAHAPREGVKPYLSLEEAVAIAEAGKRAGCHEALFTLGDKPELRYRSAREELKRLNHESTLSYVAEVARAVFERTGLLPHINPGIMSAEDLAMLRKVSVSQGIMLESASDRLCTKGGAHYGSPDKVPAVRLETIRAAGEQAVPFTSGILIGIGETRAERIDALLALRDLNDRYGHIQEIIIQNFRPKADTRMANVPAPSVDDHLWTIAIARLIFEPGMNIQAPPNLSPAALGQVVAAGINDWGGVSPVTPDHVNPEAPWPHLRLLEVATRSAGKRLAKRLPIYPEFARSSSRWVDTKLLKSVLDRVDGDGLPRTDDWHPGHVGALPARELEWLKQKSTVLSSGVGPIIEKAQRGDELAESEIVRLFRSHEDDFAHVCRAADELRREVNGDTVSYVVCRNINYTNICSFKCQFCAFSKGKMSENLRGKPYDLEMTEVAQRVTEAWDRGASEVCMQGGIHPSYTGQKYLDVCRAVKGAEPAMHLHAFSPLEIYQGAQTLGIPVVEFLQQLKAAGLGTLPGTAAEILDDEVREVLCADKIRTQQWLDVMRTAHSLGFKSTATIMFGHIERYEHWARHLLRVRRLQAETGGFLEFVPLPFVHMEAPVYLKGRARPGPTFREAILMHAVARLVLNPLITNIQASWVKMGAEGIRQCLSAGVNDLGGTLMDESISRSAGASHGQEMTPQEMEQIIAGAGRVARQRTTTYGNAGEVRRQRSFDAVLERQTDAGGRTATA
ncbi:MAG: 5-amino-6-(D-ribitylamino)uracil--L-tyrosine 4-hydroxyphenyl transferase CofH [Afipia sp.]|nr:5-amino-6-(D-ribitylamino)uracil--L-tyrosine 4-hydroxyphenyl transferase CofH [Afipia sp.]